jgi:histidine ammonia-lyase
MALKINNLVQGYSGVSHSLVKLLISSFNQQLIPAIPSKGSVGASGDLVPLSHMVAPFLGEGMFHYQNELIPAKQGLSKLGMEEGLTLGPKEGLALINGMQVSTAIGLSALSKTKSLFKSAVVTGALSVEASKGSVNPFDERIHQVRGHACQIKAASLYRRLFEESEIVVSHAACARVQDPYSLRCQPQVMGACLHQIEFVQETLLTEANAVSDNPLVFAKEADILSGGNFHGEIIAMACDNLALAISEIGALSERRIALLIDSNLSGLPPFLIKKSGLNSGFMIAHVSAAAAASDNKALAHPHSVDSLPTSANQEDHVSMATNGALRLLSMLENTETIVAIELLASCQGIEFHRPLKSSQALESAIATLRQQVSFLEEDRYFAKDLKSAKSLLQEGAFDQLLDL